LLCPDLLCPGFACQPVSAVSGVFLVRVHSFCVCIRTNFAPAKGWKRILCTHFFHWTQQPLMRTVIIWCEHSCAHETDTYSILEGTCMAVPKRKLSRSNTRHRRSAWKAAPDALVPLEIDGVHYVVPRRLVRAAQQGYIDISALALAPRDHTRSASRKR
jgi:large subunit ribosomal protein L32